MPETHHSVGTNGGTQRTGATPPRPAATSASSASAQDPLDQLQPALDAAKTWIEANPNVAMLGAFALGVFMGVLMRR